MVVDFQGITQNCPEIGMKLNFWQFHPTGFRVEESLANADPSLIAPS